LTMEHNFPKWLTNELEKRTWSMRELARRASISHSWVADIVSGVKPPSWDFCAAIAKPLRYTPVQIFVVAGLVPMADINMLASTDSPDADPRVSILFEVIKQLPKSQADIILDAWEVTLKVAGVEVVRPVDDITPEILANLTEWQRFLKRKREELLQEIANESSVSSNENKESATSQTGNRIRNAIDILDVASKAQEAMLALNSLKEQEAFLRGLAIADREVFDALEQLQRPIRGDKTK
jgi:transcriptional regulator with XRE-family HTH domain